VRGSDLVTLLPDGDALLVVPPFVDAHLPCLGVHVLQACAAEAGFRVGVFYANVEFAARIGEGHYYDLHGTRPHHLGEQVFAPAAYGTPPFDQGDERSRYAEELRRIAAGSELKNAREIADVVERTSWYRPVKRRHLERAERETAPWADDVSQAIAERDYKVVGCTTMFYGTAASVCLFNRIKKLRPDVITIIGGANCEGEMAEGIASLGAPIDVVFSGESEKTFVDFLRRMLQGDPPPDPIVEGEMCADLDALPPPDFTDFFRQRERLLPSSDIRFPEIDIPYETSRGCWWGEKHKCRFCAFSAAHARYRSKSPDKTIRDLKAITNVLPAQRVRMMDNVAPKESFSVLMERLEKELPSLHVYYEVRTTLSLREVLALKRAGGSNCVAGVESLSTSLLRLMRKGASARTNVAFLRYARIAGLDVFWNMLWGFPGDEVSAYEDMIDLMPKIRHLQPAGNLVPLSLDRFSAYFENPEDYGITNIRPRSMYGNFLPAHADVEKLECHFVADFECGAFANPDVILRTHEALKSWKSRWQHASIELFGGLPELKITREGPDRYRLFDSRRLPGAEASSVLDRRQAEYALVARPTEETAEAEWAVRNSLAVARNKWLVPLATTDAEVLLELENH